jgi:hypothetical protein
MTDATLAAQSPLIFRRNDYSEALLHAVVAIVIVIASVSAFAVSTTFGIAATFAITLLVAIVLPAGIPFLIATSFLFQNAVIAWYTPLIPDTTTFDAMRGANFVMLMTAFAAFLAASFQARVRGILPLRPWLIAGIMLTGAVTVYLGLGIVRGVPQDAIVYFRNTITPVACFYVAVTAASVYRVDLRRTILWLGTAAIIYGYLELFFAMDFLSLFHGDEYIRSTIWRQIETGVWEKALRDTGFVLRGLEDVMMTNVFNLPLLGDVFPKVFRIGGPNFHSIAFAYALSVMSVWLLFNRRWVLPLAALPLLLVIGSKGAMIMLLMAMLVRVAMRTIGPRPTLILTLALAITWVGAAIAFGMRSGDYHVLGLFAGLDGFAHNPFGQGLGFGGNLSSTSVNINWDLAQAEGVAGTPMESAVGVMLYQMGLGSFVFFGFLALLARASWRAFRQSGNSSILFLFVAVVTVSANAVLQEEAYFSPLALGFCLLLGGVALGSYWNPARRNEPIA